MVIDEETREEFATIADIAKVLEVSRKTVYEYLKFDYPVAKSKFKRIRVKGIKPSMLALPRSVFERFADGWDSQNQSFIDARNHWEYFRHYPASKHLDHEFDIHNQNDANLPLSNIGDLVPLLVEMDNKIMSLSEDLYKLEHPDDNINPFGLAPKL
ncbi:hypothetical protein [Lacticaseibacillus paracasei]|uniref:hypothetical protein n=1 Tax=Lacticaseibacillus paracasei TaxID=1597 RepID=UPI003DAA34FF